MTVASPPRVRCDVRRLGVVPYLEAWDIQRSVGEQRLAGDVPDTLLLLEHPHTYTLGRRGDPANILLSETELAERGATVIQVDRGGDVTYHGPGQLVGYPILLVEEAPDVVRYVRRLEQVLINALARFGIGTGRIDGLSGVWIGDEKIAAIGVKVGRVTSHGFALNVGPDLSYFRSIIPCGIRDKGVTSMDQVLGTDQTPDMETVMEAVSQCFGEVFDMEMREGSTAAP